MPKAPAVLAVLGVCFALLGTQIVRIMTENKKTRFDGSFESVAPDLWREGYHWSFMGAAEACHSLTPYKQLYSPKTDSWSCQTQVA